MTPGDVKSEKMESRGAPNGAKREPEDSQGQPKGSQRESQKGAKSKGDQNASKSRSSEKVAKMIAKRCVPHLDLGSFSCHFSLKMH